MSSNPEQFRAEFPMSSMLDYDQPILSELIPQDFKISMYKRRTFEIARLLYLNYQEKTVSDPERFLNQSLRMVNCGTYLNYRRNNLQDLLNHPHRKKVFDLANANFCRCRLCPLCTYRKTSTWQRKAFQNVDRLARDFPVKDHQFLLLTLTVKNCQIRRLRATIDQMNHGFKKLSRTDRINKRWPFLGWVKRIEVTRNKEDKTAHPHIHVLGLTHKNYFQSQNNNYIDHQTWRQNWGKVLNLNYEPLVNIKAVKSDNEDELKKAFLEVIKYEMKPADYRGDWRWLGQYAEQVHGKHFIDVGGVLNRYLKIEREDDLIHGADKNQTRKVQSNNYTHFEWDSKSQVHVANDFEL